MRFGPVRIAIAGFCLLAPMSLLAGSGWTGFAPVAELTPTAQYRYIARIEVDQNPSGCRNAEYFFQDYSVAGSELMFHTLLSAVETGTHVRVYVTGKCDLDGNSEISSVSIARHSPR
ncbi:MAG: hypothetical protein AMJ66_06660 [Betaproteobacteria bacterium SG8_40]|jgi:hypothetical protein|nr:MAG: hypothetical protein AMJ66_06660 [Betaproteobacteria bacterium SG8_40]